MCLVFSPFRSFKMWQFFYHSISAHLATQLNWEINIMKYVHVQFTLYSDTIMVFTVVLCVPILIYICWFFFSHIFVSPFSVDPSSFFNRNRDAFKCYSMNDSVALFLSCFYFTWKYLCIRFVSPVLCCYFWNIYVSSYVNGPFPSCRIAFVIFFISLIAYLILYCRNICSNRMLFSQCFFSLLIRYFVCVFWLFPATYYNMLFARSNHCGSNIIRRIIVNQNH